MKRFLFILWLLPVIGHAQSDVLLLQKHGKNIRTYVPGDPIMLQTVYDQWFDGTLTLLRNDSVFINGIAFHTNEIKTIRRRREKLNYDADGKILVLAGVGWLALNAVNGIYRGDAFKDWYTTSGLIIGGVLIGGGYLLWRARIKTYPIGKTYGLHYLDMSSYKHKSVQPIHQP